MSEEKIKINWWPGIFIVGVILLGVIFCLCGCNATFYSSYYKDNGFNKEYGYASYNNKVAEQNAFERIHSQKQELYNERYSITEIEMINDDKYRVFGTDRNTFLVGSFIVSKSELDYLLKNETCDTNYDKIGW